MGFRTCDTVSDADREKTIANHEEHAKRFYHRFMEEARDFSLLVEETGKNNPAGLKDLLPQVFYFEGRIMAINKCTYWCIFWEGSMHPQHEKFRLRACLTEFMAAFGRLLHKYYDTYSLEGKLRVKGTDDPSYVPSAYVPIACPENECFLAVAGPHNPL